jgi:hypothetical protein
VAKSITSRPQNLQTKCLVSGQPTANGALYVGEGERNAEAYAVAAARESMVAEGFTETQTPNLFQKDGKNLSVEAYRRGRRV